MRSMENRHGSLGAEGMTRRGEEVASLLMFGFTLFLAVAIWTYSPTDPSLFNTYQGLARNACGWVGAQLSSLSLHFLGLGAFLIPAASFFVAANLLSREGRPRLLGSLGGMFASSLALTVFVSIQWSSWPYSGQELPTGGLLGHALSGFFLKHFNSTGASIVSLLIFLLAIALSTPLSVARGLARALYVSAVLLGRIGLRLGVYLGRLIAWGAGVVAMKGAYYVGDRLSQFLAAAVEKSKQAKLGPRPPADAIEVKAQDLKPAQAGEEQAETEVLDGDTDEDSENEEEEESELFIGADIPKEKVNRSKSPLETTLSSEAPNVLPELHMDSEGEVLSPRASKVNPAIVPPAPQQMALGLEANALNAQASGASAAGRPSLKSVLRGPKAKRGQWKLPTPNFLRTVPKVESSVDHERLRQNAATLTQKFLDFGIEGQVTAVRPGPVITLYEFKPGPGVKVSRIASLADDLSMALSAQSVRILAPLPGKAVVGIEIPSDSRQTVYFREFLEGKEFFSEKYLLPVVMGKDIGGAPILSDLAKMPHLLTAGQTGSGKSVFMNGLICSLLYRFTPDELRLILVDPKFIEFRAYQDIPHLLLPVVDDPKSASTALKWAVREMERRYRILAMMGSRNLAAFNSKVEEMGSDVVRDLLLSEENQPQGNPQVSGGDWIEAFEADEGGAPRIGKLPYIVVIIDELADLMMIAKKEVEISIARIAQKARAAGIHLVIATQRPSTDVVTGLIKANLPSRVSFQLASYIDSRTILDRPGAERLLGQGDMLFVPPGMAQLLRLHGAYLDDDEIAKVTSFLKEQGKPVYREDILVDDEEAVAEENGEDEVDALFEEAVEIAKRSGQVSASSIQRHLKVGYNRAARMVEMMEMRGIVGPADGARPREVLIR